jgi:hypothetical protein
VLHQELLFEHGNLPIAIRVGLGVVERVFLRLVKLLTNLILTIIDSQVDLVYLER